MKFTLAQAKDIGNELNLNPKVIPIDELLYGLNAELEHMQTVKGNKDMVISIVLDHLEEYPDYYRRLRKMEKEAEKYWKSKSKSIYL